MAKTYYITTTQGLFFDFLRAGEIPILLGDIDRMLRADGVEPLVASAG